MSRNRRFAGFWILAASIAAVSCGSNKDAPVPSDAGIPDGPSTPAVGGKFGAALASVATAAGSGGPAKARSKDGDQPPENGIFTVEEAERRVPKDGPPKVDVISEGSDPKVQLVPRLDAPEQKATLSVGIRISQGRLPALEFALSIKPEKEKAKTDKAADKPADAAKDAPAADAKVRMAATVLGASVPAAAGIPKDLADAVGKLKGTVVRYDVAPNGAAQGFTVELSKEGAEGPELVPDALVDAIGMLNVIVPPTPVGKDGYWIVGDRAKAAAGMEILRYRVFKVLSVDEGGVSLSIDIRQYAADTKVKLDTGAGQKQELTIDAFDSQGKGTLQWKADSFLPVRGDFTERLGARLSMGGAGPARGAPMVQMEVTASIGAPASATPDKNAPEKK